MSYAICFMCEGTMIRIPVNPEEISIDEGQEIEEFNILKLGKIKVPSVMQPVKYSFEAEFPSKPYHYVVTPNGFKPADFYINTFREWRSKGKEIRFTATNGVKDISSLVLIESMKEVEKAGEEGDYYISFDLVEYKPFAMKEASSAAQASPVRQADPTIPKMYTIVKGDSLWAIAKKFLGNGSRYPEIYNMNKPPLGKNPNLIYPGQQIKIPAK